MPGPPRSFALPPLQRATLAYSLALVPADKRTDATVLANSRIARDVLEAVALFSARTADVAAFDRSVQQLKPYYGDFRSLVGDSDLRLTITGLYLLSLLSAGDSAQFHMELELLAEADRADKWVSAASELDQQLMEGSYARAAGVRKLLPKPDLAVAFFTVLEASIRDRIASCAEQCYDRYPMAKLPALLMLPSAADAVEFQQGRGWRTSEDGQYVVFDRTVTADPAAAAKSTVVQLLANATQLERIV